MVKLKLVLALWLHATLVVLPSVTAQYYEYQNYPDFFQMSGTSNSYDPGVNTQQEQSQSNPSSNDSDEDFDADDLAYLRNFMEKYEYLEERHTRVISKEEEEDAIRRIQIMAGLKVTGKLNNETLAKIKGPRCGNSDKPVDNSEMRRRRRFVIQHGWSKRSLTWHIRNFTPDLQRATTKRVIASAFQVWSDVAQLNFREVNSNNADIVILFARLEHGDGYAFDKAGGTLAHAYFPGSGIGGDVHFDEDEDFTDRTQRGTNLFIVAAHEIGHSLGLAHSDVSGALMAPYYQGYRNNFRLPQDDIRGIRELYGTRQPPNRPQGPNRPSGPSRPPNSPKDRAVCNANVNAVAYGALPGQPAALYVFSGEQFWVKRPNEPASNAQQTETVFVDMQSIPDAAFIRAVRNHRRMVFFSGQEIMEFSQGAYNPRDIRERTGINVNSVDAAFQWARNNKIYVFAGTRYWRLNENTMRADRGYPRTIKDNWRGRNGPFSAVWTENKKSESYFLIGRNVHTFKDNQVFFTAPTKSFSSDWLLCGQNLGAAGSGTRVTISLLLLVSSLYAALQYAL